MSKVVVIGFPGDAKLYLADMDLGTISELENGRDLLGSPRQIEDLGGAVIKDVDFAVAISSAAPVSAGLFDA